MNHLVSSAGKDEDAAASMAAADTDSDPDRLWTRAGAIISSLTMGSAWDGGTVSVLRTLSWRGETHTTCSLWGHVYP